VRESRPRITSDSPPVVQRDIVVIGGSAIAIGALQRMVRGLDGQCSAAIFIVGHTAAGSRPPRYRGKPDIAEADADNLAPGAVSGPPSVFIRPLCGGRCGKAVTAAWRARKD
jgi:hypothetical protein